MCVCGVCVCVCGVVCVCVCVCVCVGVVVVWGGGWVVGGFGGCVCVCVCCVCVCIERSGQIFLAMPRALSTYFLYPPVVPEWAVPPSHRRRQGEGGVAYRAVARGRGGNMDF